MSDEDRALLREILNELRQINERAREKRDKRPATDWNKIASLLGYNGHAF